MTKEIQTRLAEAIEIRKELQKLGIFVVPENQTKIKEACNIFVQDGKSCTIQLQIPYSQTKIKVSFSIKPTQQSGVTVIHS